MRLKFDGFDMMMLWMTIGVILLATAAGVQFHSLPIALAIFGVYSIIIASLYARANMRSDSKDSVERAKRGFK